MSDMGHRKSKTKAMKTEKARPAAYLHLLNNIEPTFLDISEDSPKPNEYEIAKQWGQRSSHFSNNAYIQ
ncbi:MAG UNVERIFIED_CONTAM: hypothetical protein LVR29_31270 [Microcystis novacekii LVE1205-3]|jgi:hypothetical protein